MTSTKGGTAVSATTIQIPAEHVDAIRRSLTGWEGDARRRGEVDGLLGQLARPAPGDARPCRLTGSRELLWNAVYDALCSAAEQLADDCNDYWSGSIDPDEARAALAAVGARLELLVGLGDPPAG